MIKLALTRRCMGSRETAALPMSLVVEAVEKVPKRILGRDAEKRDLIQWATINDLMLGKGQVTPENHPLIAVRVSSTGLLVALQVRSPDLFLARR